MRRFLRSVAAALVALSLASSCALADVSESGSGVQSIGGMRGSLSAAQVRNGIGAAFCASSCVRTADWLAALEGTVPGATQDLSTSISDGPTGPVYRAWRSPFAEPGNALVTFVQARYSLSTAQVNAVFTVAGAVTTTVGATVPFTLPALTGDVTTTLGSSSTTIAPGAVTAAKMAAGAAVANLGYAPVSRAGDAMSGALGVISPTCSDNTSAAIASSWTVSCQIIRTFQAYGAHGDGIYDDTTAITNALSSGRPLLCHGRFKVTAAVAVTLSASQTSFVQGTGRQGCQILLASASASITINGSTPDSVTTSQIVWHDVAIVPTAGLTSGAALTIAFPNTGPSAGRTDPMIDLRNLVFIGSGGGYPFGCLHLSNVLNSVVDNISCTGNLGGYMPGSYGVLYDGAGAPVTTTMRDVRGYSVDTCIGLSGTWQGVKVEDPTCVTARVGITANTVYDPTLVNVLLTIEHTDYAVNDFGVQAIDIPEVNVLDSHIYLFNSGTAYTTSPMCVSYTQTNNAATAGVALFGKYMRNHCDGLNRSGSGLTKFGFHMNSTYGGAFNMYEIVSDNTFNGLDTGIDLGSGTHAVFIGMNAYTGVTSHIANAGTGNVIAAAPTALPVGVVQQ